MLSPPIPMRDTMAAGRAVMHRMMMRVVRENGRWTTGTPISRAENNGFNGIADVKGAV